MAVRARYARAIAKAGDVGNAQRVLDTLDRGAASLPGEVRAGLDAQAAYVLAAAGRAGEAARRAWAAMSAFGALHDPKRSGAAGVHAARLILKDAGPWRAVIGAWCQEREIAEETVREVVELSGAILRYEARFRADGLLPPDGRVGSVHGYDFGRAVNMARWGLNAGYCDAEEAEGRPHGRYRASRVYASWGAFSAGCVLGRMPRFDEGAFGEWYERSLAAHPILAEAPDSPRRRMAWG